MWSYYTGARAAQYGQRWRRYSERTHRAALDTVDWHALDAVRGRLGRGPRILDVGCGTGLLLQQLLARAPESEVWGVDASADMLTQAQARLATDGRAHLLNARLDGAAPPGLPAAFDLITCVNVAHYFAHPVETLALLRERLAAEGQLVLVDFAPRAWPFPWPVFERLIRLYDGEHVRAYTSQQAATLCEEARLTVAASREIAIDWLWRGWALRASG